MQKERERFASYLIRQREKEGRKRGRREGTKGRVRESKREVGRN